MSEDNARYILSFHIGSEILVVLSHLACHYNIVFTSNFPLQTDLLKRRCLQESVRVVRLDDLLLDTEKAQSWALPLVKDVRLIKSLGEDLLWFWKTCWTL